ncbi:hypothetical protein AQUCO_03300049v1 [Aquilegia coerulea]|uniref:AAA+ ATPase domain-containing protein n=1 Tax=Aquilegia coerulea TaxID=218851 RepID=A0A2G5CZ88_AQUCA|nr:hypothetical protein AQUCO_03300049v1 [Aquilegia coerulea]
MILSWLFNSMETDIYDLFMFYDIVDGLWTGLTEIYVHARNQASVLKDADEKQVKDEVVKFWLEQLKDVSYDAGDVLDEWITKTLLSKLQKPEVSAPIKENVCSILYSFACCFKPVVLRHEVGVKIRELNERLDWIATNKERYTLTESRIQKESRPLTSSIVDVSDIYGRLDDKEVIVSKLLGESSCRDSKVPVISIVGTGGFGKTTLAQLILKEMQGFKQMWVCVSDPFDHQKVAKQIIEEATGKVIDSVGWQALHMKLSESVKGKRFILVLDDVWSFNGDIWKQLKTSLDGAAIGSRIIITTRDVKIAKLMDSTYIHWLGQLSDDDSWLMFRRIAFWRREDDLEILEDIAKDIAKKCKGNIQGWRSVQASNIWDAQEGGAGFLPSILFSYYALPAELKPCLVYCAILPKDARIYKMEMVKLWMAQGFLGSDGSKDLEVEGGHYFDDLAMRSFFQDFEHDSKGNITPCKMHDYVQFLSQSEICILNKDEELKNINVLHLSTLTFDNSSICKLKKLHTLRQVFDYGHCSNKITNLGLFRQLACLRVLDLRGRDLEELPRETLKLRSCYEFSKLPKGIGKLSNLRHLEINHSFKLTFLPQGLGRLSCLRTLHNFITGDGDGIEGVGCNIRELKLLNHLQGKLRIGNLGRVANANDVAEAKLDKKKNLRSLILSFSSANDDGEGILKGLVPNTNLEELKVEYYGGTKLPYWISSFDFNFVSLELDSLKGLLQLPTLRKLPFLEVLVLTKLKSVKHIGEEFYGFSSFGGGGGKDSVQQHIVFPKLKKLKLSYMDAWDEWDSPENGNYNIDFFPNLCELEIGYCLKLKVIPFYLFSHALRSLGVCECPQLT